LINYSIFLIIILQVIHLDFLVNVSNILFD
jgi:hypothetical protein